ncbi:MAG TPA: hypothetical protein VKN18_18195 [Blastocatellia bacterium]|nr:hypothetical protein [Blastocatellia bacterium]
MLPFKQADQLSPSKSNVFSVTRVALVLGAKGNHYYTPADRMVLRILLQNTSNPPTFALIITGNHSRKSLIPD